MHRHVMVISPMPILTWMQMMMMMMGDVYRNNQWLEFETFFQFGEQALLPLFVFAIAIVMRRAPRVVPVALRITFTAFEMTEMFAMVRFHENRKRHLVFALSGRNEKSDQQQKTRHRKSDTKDEH